MVQEEVGIKSMVERAAESYETFPMLEVIFEKFIRIASVSLRYLVEDNVDLSLRSINSTRFGNYIKQIPIPNLVTVFDAVEWNGFGLLLMDKQLIFNLVDMLLGGKKNDNNQNLSERSYTSIEQSIVKQVCDILFSNMEEAFELLSHINFRFERIESDPRFASIARQTDYVILIIIDVCIGDRRGKIELLFPYDTLKPIREQLLQIFIGDNFEKDKEWENRLLHNMLNINVELEAILHGNPSLIEDIMHMKIGNTILMQDNPEDHLVIYCQNKRMFTAKLGKISNKMAISINESIHEFKKREGKK